ncbi:CBU_0592 family membrane protein [Microbispora sp. CA-102843]|uniref:CBU_0592 family membrane protein n=1 Tax=Microbispora sp. CA-102843 TaxID=3239952 RepID=UPI003D940E1D
MDQVLQIAGAILILGAFLLSQMNVLDNSSKIYLTLNLVGSAVLAWLAYAGDDWGFLLLEGVWALVSAVSLIRALRPRQAAP